MVLIRHCRQSLNIQVDTHEQKFPHGMRLNLLWIQEEIGQGLGAGSSLTNTFKIMRMLYLNLAFKVIMKVHLSSLEAKLISLSGL